MTAQSSFKGSFVPFLTYLKYRLGLLKINFVMCCILNVLGLPLYAAAANVGFGGGVSEFAMTARVFSTICVAALPVIAMFNAISAFDYYHKKDLTDTIGALPLSFRERFFADLLAGYAINVLPVIPCGIACVIALGNTQRKFRGFHHAFSDNCRFRMASVGAIIVMALIVIITFAYLFTVLTSVCCGKVYHTVIFSLFGMAVLPLLSYGLVRSFINSVVGLRYGENYILRGVAFFPPIGVLHDLFEAMGVAFQANLDWEVKENPAGEHFSVSEPVHIAVYVLLALGLVLLAYSLAKRRLAEHTGSAFAVKPAFNVLSAGLAAGVTITMLAMCYILIEYYILVAAAAGALTFLVMLLLNPRGKKATLRSLIVGAAAIASILGVWLLIFKTGSFGLRYLPKNPDKVGCIRINNAYKITDEADIEKYVTLFNDRLRTYPKEMEYVDNPWSSDSFYVEVQKTDGKTIERYYSGAESGMYIFSCLDGYVDYFFDSLNPDVNYSCRVRSDNGDIYIPNEKTGEFVAILREEASEKHYPNAAEFAEVVFHGDKTFIIERSYTRTIEFLESLNEDSEVDPEAQYLHITYNVRQEYWDRLMVNISYKDRDDARVKELVDLLKNGRGTRDYAFDVHSQYIAGLGDVTERNRDRVLEIMAELAAEAIGG